MSGIFINYPRDDAPGVGAGFSTISREVFAPPGLHRCRHRCRRYEARPRLREQLDARVTHLLLVVIGPNWLNVQDDKDRRRLDDQKDYVRIETASALKRDIPSFRCSSTAPACRPSAGMPSNCATLALTPILT